MASFPRKNAFSTASLLPKDRFEQFMSTAAAGEQVVMVHALPQNILDMIPETEDVSLELLARTEWVAFV